MYEYNALLKLIPDLKKDIELLDDDDIKSLSNYVRNFSVHVSCTNFALSADQV